MSEAYIKRVRGNISLLEFQKAISHAELCESGEHFTFDGLTGEPIHQSGKGLVYVLSDQKEVGLIRFENGQIYIEYIHDELCEYLCQKLKAQVHPIYYHG